MVCNQKHVKWSPSTKPWGTPRLISIDWDPSLPTAAACLCGQGNCFPVLHCCVLNSAGLLRVKNCHSQGYNGHWRSRFQHRLFCSAASFMKLRRLRMWSCSPCLQAGLWQNLFHRSSPTAVNTGRAPDRQVSSFIIGLSITQTEILDKQSSEFLCCQSVTPFQITLCSRGATLVADHIAASFSRHLWCVSAFSNHTN